MEEQNVKNLELKKTICPFCKNELKKNGTRANKQRYRCVCGYSCTEVALKKTPSKKTLMAVKRFIRSFMHGAKYENANDKRWKYELSDNIDAFVPNKSFLITYVDNTIRVMPYKNVKEEMTKKITMSANDN